MRKDGDCDANTCIYFWNDPTFTDSTGIGGTNHDYSRRRVCWYSGNTTW